MKKLNSISLLIAVATVLLCSCQRGGGTAQLSGGDTIRMEYAKRLQMVEYGQYTVATLADPWNPGKTLHTYILVSGKKASDSPRNRHTTLKEIQKAYPTATVVNVPLKRAVITTSVHCGLIMQFGKGDAIRGVCDLQYINLPWIQQRCKEGAIANCGNGITPTLETIIGIDADAVIISPFQNSGGYGRLSSWGRPIIEAADYMETSALGRAEWMKFYGRLFDAENQADSMFAVVKQNYTKLKSLAARSETRRRMIIDKINSSVWYMPGGNSTLGQMMADANAGYPFAADKSSGSIQLTFEAVLEKASDADVWLIRYNSKQPATYNSLLSENQGYARFKAFKDKQVYGCNTYYINFYEETPFHPDMLLRDFVIIAHPDLKLGTPKYFNLLK